MKAIKPMLAVEADLAKLVFPLYATPKLDGVRAMLTADGVMSRSWKALPNKRAQQDFRVLCLVGLDGELIVGEPTAPDVYRKTQSVLARADDTTEAVFYAFDVWGMSERPYEERQRLVKDMVFTAHRQNLRVVQVETRYCGNMDDLLAFENRMLEAGYEGLILRSPAAPYKHGRSTVNEGGMLKLKRFADSEAEIIGIEEEMENRNAATKDAFGRTERSSHKENLVGKGRMGALIVRDVTTKVEFKIGTGFTAADRERFWQELADGPGDGPYPVVKYKHFVIGAKDKPRFPTYLGMRAGWDR